MALLSRTLAILTRVVVGYRVSERNTIGGYFVVRDRNVHTWVESWTEESGWQTWEPTAGGLYAGQPQQSPLLSAAVDFTAEMFRALGARISELSVMDMVVIAGILLFAWVVLVLIRRLRRRAFTKPLSIQAYSAPPEAISRLMTTLACGRRTNPGDQRACGPIR